MGASALGSDFLEGVLMECWFYKCSPKKIIPYPYMEMLLTVSPA